MNTLLVYFSRTGNNKTLAEKIQTALNIESEPLIDNTKRTGLFGFLKSGFQAMTKKLVTLQELKHSIPNYDQIILVTPFWVGSLPPATRTFLAEQGKNIKELIVASVSGNGEGNTSVISEINAYIEKPVKIKMMLTEEQYEEVDRKLPDFLKQVNGN